MEWFRDTATQGDPARGEFRPAAHRLAEAAFPWISFQPERFSGRAPREDAEKRQSRCVYSGGFWLGYRREFQRVVQANSAGRVFPHGRRMAATVQSALAEYSGPHFSTKAATAQGDEPARQSAGHLDQGQSVRPIPGDCFGRTYRHYVA